MDEEASQSKKNLVLRATHSGNLDAVKDFKKDFPDLRWSEIAYDETGDTILHVAARLGYVDIILYLLAKFHSTPIDFKNRDGKTALHEAAQFAQHEVVHLLLKRGADPNALKRSDWTPLMLACTKINKAENKKNNWRCIDLLIKAGALVNYKNKDGWTALHLVCREGNLDVLKLLVLNDANVSAKTNNGRTSLHIASLHGNLDIVEYLLGKSIDADAKDTSGNTPLHEAALGGDVRIVMLLLKCGATVKTLNKSGFTALHLAASTGHLVIINYLVNDMKFDKDPKSHTKLTPLHCAARHNRKDAYNLLIELGAKEDVKDIFGRYPCDYLTLKNS